MIIFNEKLLRRNLLKIWKMRFVLIFPMRFCLFFFACVLFQSYNCVSVYIIFKSTNEKGKIIEVFHRFSEAKKRYAKMYDICITFTVLIHFALFSI